MTSFPHVTPKRQNKRNEGNILFYEYRDFGEETKKSKFERKLSTWLGCDVLSWNLHPSVPQLSQGTNPGEGAKTVTGTTDPGPKWVMVPYETKESSQLPEIIPVEPNAPCRSNMPCSLLKACPKWSHSYRTSTYLPLYISPQPGC